LLASCARDAAAPSCAASAESALAFAGEDTVSVRIEGPRCDAAIGVLTVRTAGGAPLWAWAAPLHPTFGDYFAPGARTATAEEVQAFATRWAGLAASSTAEAPPWPDGAPAPLGAAHTAFEREIYEDVRARALPMACHLSGVARETCIVYEPAAAAAMAFLERDVAATP
jgi:hypothetical protein